MGKFAWFKIIGLLDVHDDLLKGFTKLAEPVPCDCVGNVNDDIVNADSNVR